MAYFIKIRSIRIFPLQTVQPAEPPGRCWLKDTQLEKSQAEKLKLEPISQEETCANDMKCWAQN